MHGLSTLRCHGLSRRLRRPMIRLWPYFNLNLATRLCGRNRGRRRDLAGSLYAWEGVRGLPWMWLDPKVRYTFRLLKGTTSWLFMTIATSRTDLTISGNGNLIGALTAMRMLLKSTTFM